MGSNLQRRRDRVTRVRLACDTVRARVARLRDMARGDDTHRAMLEDTADALIAAILAIESLAESLDVR